VETDAQGRFHIHGEWGTERDLVFRGPNDYSLSIDTVKLRVNERVEFEAVVQAGFDLGGTVTRFDDGGKIAGASIRLTRDEEGLDARQAAWGWVDTDANGRFLFRHVPAGAYVLHVVQRGREASVQRIQLSGDVSLPIAMAAARELVVKFKNLPVEWRGARVNLMLSERAWPALYVDFAEKIDAHDELRVDAPPPGKYRAELLPGRSPLPRMGIDEYVVTKDRAEPIVFVLPKGARVEGSVTRPDATPLAKAIISVETGEMSTRTDADGKFMLPFVPTGKNRLLLGIAPGTRLAVADIAVPEHGAVRVDVRLPGTATVRGRFVTEGSDWSRIVQLHRKGEEQALAICRARGAGHFTIPYLAAGDYELRAQGQDSDWLRRTVFVEEGATLDLGALRPAEYPSIPVRVTVPQDSEMPGAFAVAFWEKKDKGLHHGKIELDRAGNGFLRGLPEREGYLRFELPGFERVTIPLKLARGMPRIEFALKSAPVKHAVGIRLDVDEPGLVPDVIQIAAKGRGSAPAAWVFLILDKGLAQGRLQALPAGHYTLQFRVQGLQHKDVDIEIVSAEQKPIRIRLEKAD
jgi:hypothetical protein